MINLYLWVDGSKIMVPQKISLKHFITVTFTSGKIMLISERYLLPSLRKST